MHRYGVCHATAWIEPTGWMDGWTDGVYRAGGRMHRYRVHASIYIPDNGWMDRACLVDGWMDGWMES